MSQKAMIEIKGRSLLITINIKMLVLINYVIAVILLLLNRFVEKQ